MGAVLPPGLGGTNPAFGGQSPGQIAQNPHQSGITPPGKLKAKLDQEGDQNKTLIASKPNSSFRPIAYTETTRLGSGRELFLKCMSSPASKAFMLDGCDVEYVSEKAQVLRDGEVLLDCFTRNSMMCGDYEVKISPGSVVLATKDNDNFAVTVLHDSGKGAERVISRSGDLIEVCAGEELIIGPNAHHYSKQGRRRISNHSFNSGDALSLREFSLVALSVQNDLVAHALRRKENNLSGKLLKTAACLDFVRKSHGPYH